MKEGDSPKRKNSQRPDWCPDTCPMRIGQKKTICSLQQLKLSGIGTQSNMLAKERQLLNDAASKLKPAEVIFWCTHFEGNGL